MKTAGEAQPDSNDPWLPLTETINLSNTAARSDGEEKRDLSSLSKGDETQHGSTELNRLGTDGSLHQHLVEADDDQVKVEDIIKRFAEHPTARMMAARTRRSYSGVFRRFAKTIDLERFNRRQLAGPKGKRAILEYMTGIPERSIAPHLAALSKVWTLSLNLPWPIEMDRDVGRLPRIRRREAPDTEKVRIWAERLESEQDPYLRALWLMVAQSGQRLSTVANLSWRCVRYDEKKQPFEIRANGADEGFKTHAQIAWWLPEDVKQALIELRKHLGDPREDSPLFPWMNGWGRTTPTKRDLESAKRKLDRADADMLRRHWERLEKKYSLPHLTSGDLRHWVASQARDPPCLREEARAYMQGHEQQITNMGDVYDHRSIEQNLQEQARKFPEGPLGLFKRLDVEIAEDVPQEIMKALVAYRENRLGYPDLFKAVENWRIEGKVEVQK